MRTSTQMALGLLLLVGALGIASAQDVSVDVIPAPASLPAVAPTPGSDDPTDIPAAPVPAPVVETPTITAPASEPAPVAPVAPASEPSQSPVAGSAAISVRFISFEALVASSVSMAVTALNLMF